MVSKFFLFICVSHLLLVKCLFAQEQFRYRLREDALTLDWNYGEVNREIVEQLMQGLFATDQFGKSQAAVAKDWRFLNNQKTLKINLKKHLTWSDGKPLCAKEFVDSWNRLKSSKLASPFAHYADILKSYQASGCHQLIIQFTRTAPEALALLSHYVFYPIRSDQLQKNPKIFTHGKGLLVNGRFIVEKWQPKQKLVLKRNQEFQKKSAKSINKIEFLFIESDMTAQMLFKQKKIDAVKSVAPLLRKQYAGEPELKVFPTLIAYFFGIYVKKNSILYDGKIRRALSQVLDRVELSRFLGEEVQGTENWLLREMVNDLPAPPKLSGSELVAAKKKIKLNPQQITLRIYNKKAHKLLAEWAQEQWLKKLELKVVIEIQEEKVYWQKIANDHPDIFLSGVTAPFNHAYAFQKEFLSTSTANWTSWKSQKYDQLVKQGKVIQAESKLLTEGFVIPLYRRGTVILIHKQWRNFWINPLGVTDFSTVLFEAK